MKEKCLPKKFIGNELRNKMVKAILLSKQHGKLAFEDELTLNRLAKQLGISPYHFHHLFSIFMNQPIGRFIKKLKMENAIYQLSLQAKKTITEIALDLGYENVSSFNRAFKKEIKMTPTEFIKKYNENVAILMTVLAQFSKEVITTGEFMNTNESLTAEIITLPKRYIAYVQVKGNYFVSAKMAWEKLDKLRKEFQELNDERNYFGMSLDNPHAKAIKEEDLRFNACVEIDHQEVMKMKSHFSIMELDGGKYAKFIHRGPWELLGDTFHIIYGEWVYKNDAKLRDEPTTVKMLDIWQTEKNHLERLSEVYLPIR